MSQFFSKRRLKIAEQIIIVSFFAVLIPMTVSGIIINNINQQSNRAQLREAAVMIANIVSEEIEVFDHSINNELSQIIATMEYYKNPAQEQKYLDTIIERLPFYRELAIVEKDQLEKYKMRATNNLRFIGVCAAALVAIPALCSVTIKPVMSKILKIDNIEKYYGNRSNLTKAIDGISFDVEKGEFVAIMGASGSGKTTLLNCISTIDRVTSGHIYVADEDITKLKGNKLNKYRSHELGFIFQDFNLLDTLTAYENIALALSIQNTKPREISKRVNEVARKLDIQDVLQKYPYQMSGGQRQRVASARAIITNPKLVLADEPTGALDSKSSKMLLESFNHLNNEFKTTILMVTHDAFTAVSYTHLTLPTILLV